VRVSRRSGFTILESLIAVVVLSVGVLALVGSSALTSRMVGQGAVATRAGLIAATRIERLRQIASSTVPPCTGAEWHSGSSGGPGLVETWELLDAPGPVRRVRIVVRSRHPTGTSSDTVVAGFLCVTP
jgi:prepilin-type N-terminal cleavage/methylation domain-containing protein